MSGTTISILAAFDLFDSDDRHRRSVHEKGQKLRGLFSGKPRAEWMGGSPLRTGVGYERMASYGALGKPLEERGCFIL